MTEPFSGDSQNQSSRGGDSCGSNELTSSQWQVRVNHGECPRHPPLAFAFMPQTNGNLPRRSAECPVKSRGYRTSLLPLAPDNFTSRPGGFVAQFPPMPTRTPRSRVLSSRPRRPRASVSQYGFRYVGFPIVRLVQYEMAFCQDEGKGIEAPVNPGSAPKVIANDDPISQTIMNQATRRGMSQFDAQL